MIRIRPILAAAALVLAAPAAGVEPDEILDDPALESRARALEETLRCVVCQSQSLAESNAPLAKDMRLILRERLVAGDTDEEVVAYLVDRYGEYVLLKPRVKPATLALWAAPFLALLAGAAAAFLYVRRRKPAPPAPLKPEEEEAVRALLEGRE
ncbi:cytochrome c-type biogenesis protein [Amphiplicatus metriothermophilus]|uniref:Cytochrome c-type biogenesis protein n=1 Tax=Amphiplicatus metriothermophilus TaxID=1519374 RepID=A0A239PSY0_9PROT|nr:cytochrome c-type biogenesis protein [Amphiplicatus metriothermophilus]MBB5519319.1 cytochrome c-type biogenesis protein CcmH [Amphiplicatus metriothermophilus]SNT73389.1 cytochrome c-type biogenesis protein CcmH [Amphiplicatus metriothermophilus]